MLAAACLLLGACASKPSRPRPQPIEWHPARDTLITYDTNRDGILSRAELETGLKAAFAEADTDRDGVLNADEIRAINEKRWAEQGSTATPLIDWRQSGRIDFNEFAASSRSLFAQMDRDSDGKLDPKEINPRAHEEKGKKPVSP